MKMETEKIERKRSTAAIIVSMENTNSKMVILESSVLFLSESEIKRPAVIPAMV